MDITDWISLDNFDKYWNIFHLIDVERGSVPQEEVRLEELPLANRVLSRTGCTTSPDPGGHWRRVFRCPGCTLFWKQLRPGGRIDPKRLRLRELPERLLNLQALIKPKEKCRLQVLFSIVTSNSNPYYFLWCSKSFYIISYLFTCW